MSANKLKVDVFGSSGGNEPIAGAKRSRLGPLLACWGAIAAGAGTASLLILGVGLNLPSVSAYSSGPGLSALLGLVGLAITQLLAAGVCSYLVGRFGPGSASLAADRIVLRDVVNGVIAWTIVSVITATPLSAAIEASARATSSMSQAGPINVDLVQLSRSASARALAEESVEILLRRPANGKPREAMGMDTSADELTGILISATQMGVLPPAHLRYASQLVSRQTGLPRREAELRTIEAYAQLKIALRALESSTQAAQEARYRISIFTTLWLFAALLIGAFAAGTAARRGGHWRDR